MKKTVSCLLILSILLAMLLPGCSLFDDDSPGVLIYELYTSGGYSSGESYAPYKYSYVVLYNSNDEDVDLTGWTLRFFKAYTTDPGENSTAELSGTIGAKQFLVVQGGYADDIGEFVVGEELPFDVDLVLPEFRPLRKIGILALCDSNGLGATSITSEASFLSDYITYSQETSDLFESASYGPIMGISVKKVLRRVSFENSGNNAADFKTKDIIDKPANIIFYTKGMTSETLAARVDYTNAIINFSHEAGYYSQEFILKIDTDLAANPKIYYTTDGTPPISSAGKIAATAIEYNDSEGVRIYDRTGEPTNLMNETGLQPEDYTDAGTTWPPAQRSGESDSAYQERLETAFAAVYKANTIRAAAINDDNAVSPTISSSFFVSETNFEERYGLPVISLILDKDSLFKEDTGIFKDKNRELRGDDAYRSGIIQFFEESGKLGFEEDMKFCLNGGYTRVFPQKSLRINMSNADFNYDLLDGRAKDSKGNVITYFDRFILRSGGNDWGNGAMRDPFWQEYSSRLGSFEYQAQRPCVVFINGEFWGMYFIAERQDDYFIESHFGYDRDSVTIAESFSARREGDWDEINALVELRDFVMANDMRNGDAYKYFTDMVDVDSFIDYFICELYCGNTDWPQNNLKLWKSSEAMAGEPGSKWRMMINDVDFSFWQETGNYDQINWFINECEYETARMFRSLLNNDEFRGKFIKRFEYLLKNFFIEEKIFEALDTINAETATVRSEHRARWFMEESGVNYHVNLMKEYISVRNASFEKGLDLVRNWQVRF